MRVLSLRAVSKAYRAGVRGCLASAEVLRGVDLELIQGEALGIAGGRGAGKTTLLLCAAGLLRPDSGAVTWFGADHPSAAERASVAFVPELPMYYSFLTVREALHARRVTLGARDANARRRPDVSELAETLQLTVHWSVRVTCLPRALVQHVAIAEALLDGARLLLLDEADSALSADSRRTGQSVLCALRRWGVTTMVATRNARALRPLLSRIATLANGMVSVAPPRALDVPSPDRDGREPARVAERS